MVDDGAIAKTSLAASVLTYFENSFDLLKFFQTSNHLVEVNLFFGFLI